MSSLLSLSLAKVRVDRCNPFIVPLRDAKFRLKWHFKDATTHGVAVTQYAESLVTRADDNNHLSQHFAEAGRRLLQPVNALVDSALGDHNKLEASRSHSPGGNTSSGNEGVRSPNILSPIMSPHLDTTTPNPNRTPVPQSIHFNSPFSRTSTQSADDSNLSRPTRTRTSDSASTPSWAASPSMSGPHQNGGEDSALNRRRGGGETFHSPVPEANSHHRLEPKGTTNFVPLRSHTATFERTIVCPVQISARQNPTNHRYLLQPSSFKISIKQEGIDSNGHHQAEEKIGEVNLDLSQFVGKEVKSRRFLLGNCKTNSILRITVKMEFLEGENHYVAYVNTLLLLSRPWSDSPPCSPQLVNGRVTSTSSGTKSHSSSSRNSPMNRSTASRKHCFRFIALILADDITCFAVSSSPRRTPNSHTAGFSPSSLQMSRTASSTSSITSSTTSLDESSRSPSKGESLNSLTDQARKQQKARNENKIVGPNGRRKGWHPPASADHSGAAAMGYSGCQLGERNAQDIVESIFNVQPETPMTGRGAWHAHSGVKGKPNTPRPTYAESRRETRENVNQLPTPEKNLLQRPQAKKAAWSIRSFTRSKNKNPPQRQSSLDTASIAPSTSTTSSAPRSDSVRENQNPSVSVHPPTPSNGEMQRPYALERNDLSFSSSTASTQRARSPRLSASSNSASRHQTPRPASQRSTSFGSFSSLPPPLSASPPSSPSSRPLSVRFDTDRTLDGSPESSRSLKYRTSMDNLSQMSGRSGGSSMAGLGLSDSTLANAANGFNTPRSSLDLSRTRSNNSFNSVITPPSPDRTPMRKRSESGKSRR